MADIDVPEGTHQQNPGFKADAYSFGALLDKFFQTSPLGKDITAISQSVETPAQELILGNKKTASGHKRVK